jgi:methionyl aminopeptidase
MCSSGKSENRETARIYSRDEIEKIRIASEIAGGCLDYIEGFISQGISTGDIDYLCNEYIVFRGAYPASLNYKGFPKSVCTSVNKVVCHGIPGKYKLKNGDIINVDVAVNNDGWFGDTSRTFLVGKVSRLAQNLVEVTREALMIGIDAAKPGNSFGDIGIAISRFVEMNGYSVVRDYCGHGVGASYHESPPTVLHYASAEFQDLQILPGMVFTIEPMVNAGSYRTKILSDGWTAVTADGSLSAQFEHTIAITESEAEILT